MSTRHAARLAACRFMSSNRSTNMARSAASRSLVASQWYYLAATYDGTTLTSYVDGVLANATVGQGGPSTAENGTTKLGARMTINAGEFFQGLVDEARISNVARSADYVRAQHRSMRGTFVAFGPRL